MKSKWAHYKPTQTEKRKKKTEKSEKNRSSHIINKAKPKLRSEAESARAEETHTMSCWRWPTKFKRIEAGPTYKCIYKIQEQKQRQKKTEENKTQATTNYAATNEDSSRRIRDRTAEIWLQSYLEWIRICIWK